MATYDRLVAMDSNYEVLPQLKDKIAKSTEVTNAINTAVSASETKQTASNDAKYQTKTDGATKTDLANLKVLPTGGTEGQVLTKTTSGEKWATMDGLPSGGTAGQVLTKNADGSKSWSSVQQNITAVWSKEQQAKVQGFWTVVSTTEPAEKTMTLSDGTVVPVVWERPLSTIVPVVPQAPEFNRTKKTITVPDLVGVDYYLAGNIKLPKNTPYTLTQALPYTANIEAVAKPGYALPSVFTWSVLYPDLTKFKLLASDTFSTNSQVNPVPFDMGLGGSMVNKPEWVASTSGKGFYPNGNVMTITSDTITTDNVWTRAPFPDVTDTMRVEFDVIATGDTTNTLVNATFMGIVIRGRGSAYGGGNEIAFGRDGIVVANQTGIPKINKNNAVGHWVLESQGQNLFVKDPTGTEWYGTSTVDFKAQASSNAVQFRAYAGTTGTKIDNLTVSTLAV